MAPRVLLIVAAVVFGVTAQDGCAADEEGDGVGLLQSRSEAALERGDWKPMEEMCASITDHKCGDGCCELMSTCENGQCQEFMGTNTTKPTPTHVGCPVAYHEVDGGCCPPATILTKPKTCGPRTCENILMYNCSITTSGEPECTKGGSLTWSEMGDDAPIIIAKPAPPEPTVTETCTFGGKTCMRWEIKNSVYTMSDQYAPDC